SLPRKRDPKGPKARGIQRDELRYWVHRKARTDGRFGSSGDTPEALVHEVGRRGWDGRPVNEAAKAVAVAFCPPSKRGDALEAFESLQGEALRRAQAVGALAQLGDVVAQQLLVDARRAAQQLIQLVDDRQRQGSPDGAIELERKVDPGGLAGGRGQLHREPRSGRERLRWLGLSFLHPSEHVAKVRAHHALGVLAVPQRQRLLEDVAEQ